MLSLSLAALFFVGIHLFIAGTRLRDTVTGAIGERGYLPAFSLLSLIGISWLCSAYSTSPTVLLWGPIPGLRTLALLTVFVAFVFFALGLLTPNPTAMGGESRLAEDNPASGVLSVTRHPFLWGVAIWAATHLLLNGDLASLIFFGALLVLCLAGTASIDRKRRRARREGWERFEAMTSNVPFAAIASGRNHLDLAGIAGWRLAVAIGLYVVALLSHGWLFGAPAIG